MMRAISSAPRPRCHHRSLPLALSNTAPEALGLAQHFYLCDGTPLGHFSPFKANQIRRCRRTWRKDDT